MKQMQCAGHLQSQWVQILSGARGLVLCVCARRRLTTEKLLHYLRLTGHSKFHAHVGQHLPDLNSH